MGSSSCGSGFLVPNLFFCWPLPLAYTGLPALLLPALGRSVANAQDTDYAAGVGNGGLEGQPGQAGLVIITAYAYGQMAPARTTFYYSHGDIQRFSVPFSTVSGEQIEYVDIKVWGAGGGGGRPETVGRGRSQYQKDKGRMNDGSSIGGGGAFASARVSVSAGDVFEVMVGGGGGGQGASGDKYVH